MASWVCRSSTSHSTTTGRDYCVSDITVGGKDRRLILHSLGLSVATMRRIANRWAYANGAIGRMRYKSGSRARVSNRYYVKMRGK